jgi:hypothetical protein
MTRSLKNTASLLIGFTLLIGCKKDKPKPEPDPTPSYTVPTTYNFSNVDYSGQSLRMDMLDVISTYMSLAGNGTVLDAAQLKNMYNNSGNPFGNSALDASGKQLKNKTFVMDQTYFDNLFDRLAVASQSAGGSASNGVAGVEGGRLFDENGVELSQVIKKQLMGSVFYYQAIENYLANLTVDDNTTVTSGQGTTQEHHADEAFGYFGAPTNFPSNSTGNRYWSDYSTKVNAAISSNSQLMNAFLKVRAAISNKDYAARDAQIIVVREQWERVVAASAILELTEAKANFGNDNVAMRHYLSEAIGFIHSLKYNSHKKISDAQLTSALDALGTNFYTLTLLQIDTAINTINAVYGFNLNAF